MPTTSLFFLPSPTSGSITTTPSPLQTLLSQLTTTYTSTPLPPWSLSHRLFRSTPSVPIPTSTTTTTDASKQTGLRYLHILSLSHCPESNFVLITPPQNPIPAGGSPPAHSDAPAPATAPAATTPPATVITLPAGAPTEEFLVLLSSKLSPLWQPRHSIQISNGQGFEVGDFRVRIGEVRQGVGGMVQGRGVVAEVEWVGGGEEEEGEGEGMIRAFWEGLGVGGAREVGAGVEGVDGWGDVRRWCEVLRLRG